jgi:hypothetical protein
VPGGREVDARGGTPRVPEAGDWSHLCAHVPVTHGSWGCQQGI